MSKIHWSNQVSADFNTAADWSTSSVPGAADDAILDASGKTAYTVTASTSETVHSIQTASTATLSITGGTFTASAGTGSGANAGAILIGNNTIFSVGGALNNSGAISLNSGGNTTELFLAANTTLSGAGHLTLGDSTANFVFGTAAATTLTNVDNIISGAGQLGSAQMTLVNQAAGVVNATGVNALVLNTSGETVTNAGLLEATGAGGLTIQSTTVDDSTGGVIQANTGSVVNLAGADIIGGTLKTSGTGVIETAASNRTSLLDGASSTVSNTGALNITNNAFLNVQGKIANTSTISLLSAGNTTALVLAANTTLSGAGHVTLSDSGQNFIYGAVGGDTLTNFDNIISGAGQLGAAQMTLVNQAAGVVNATGVNALVLNTSGETVVNAGLLEATGAGGLLIQSTTVDDSTGGVIQANTGSVVNLAGADIIGGTLKTVGTGVIETAASNRASVLDGTSSTVSNTGVVDITNNAWLTVEGTINNTGSISLLGVGNDTELVVGAKNATIVGGAVTLSDFSQNFISGTLSGVSPNQTVSTLTNKTVISGSGNIGFNLALINDSTIDATGATALIIATGNSGVAGSNVVTNAGLLESTNPGALGAVGGLVLQNVVIANTKGKGIVEANGANTHVDLQGATIQGGALTAVNGGVIQTAASDRASVIDGSAATVTLTGPLNITNNAWLVAQGTVKNTGVISLLSVGNDTRLIVGAPNLSLTGGGKVTLSDNSQNTISAATTSAILTNVDNVISGSGLIGFGSLTLINQKGGVIDATGTAAALTLNTAGKTVTNAGLIEATGAAGLLIQNTTVDDSTGGVILAATGSVVNLQGADLVGGTLQTQGTGVFQTTNSDRASLIDGTTSTVNLAGPLNITNNAWLTAQGTVKNTGVISLLSIGNDTRFIVGAANLSLTGGGKVTLSDNSQNTISAATTSAILTNVDNVISGSGLIGFGSLTLINQKGGVIDATGTAAALTLNTAGKTVTNAGLIEATGAAGLLIQNTTVDDSTGGVILAATGSVVNLQGADLVGGTLQTQGTGVFQTTNSDRASLIDGTTSTVNLAGTLNITNNAWLTIQGAIDNTGSINLLSAGNDTRLRVAANTTLTGNGVIFLNGNANNTFEGVTAGLTLTNDGNTLEGSGNLLGANLTLINNAGGVVNGNQAAALVLSTPGRVITNAGTLEGTGAGGLTISGSVVNGTGGMVFAGAGSNVTLTASTLAGGAFSTAATGQIIVGDGSTATIDSVAGNGGTILVNGNKSTTSLIFAANTSLTGGGVLELSDSKKNVVKGTKSSVVLTNVDNTIEGSGKFGSKKLTLVNGAGGVIDGDNHNPLTIDTGGVAVSNAGLIETTASGKLTIKSALSNTGLLEANTGNLTVDGAVTGGGSAQINGGNLAFGASFTENVAFTGTSGKLILAQSQGYGGQVSGFSHKGKTSFDLQDIAFGGGTSASYSGTTTSGVLTVTDGTHTAHITLLGDYTTATFTVADDGSGGTSVTDPTAPFTPAAVPAAASAQSHQFIAAMAGLAGDSGGPVPAWMQSHGEASRQGLFSPRAHAA